MKKYITHLLFICLLLLTNNTIAQQKDTLYQNADDKQANFLVRDTFPVHPAQVSEAGSMKNPKISLRSMGSSADLSHIPTIHTVDKTKEIGDIIINQGSNQTGALTYSVPIDVYQSGNNFKPEIQIAYNSAGGNGIVGMGWNIGGISSITSSNKSLYYDNEVTAIKRNKASAFSLDGTRLIDLKTGNASLINYETEIGSIKVTATLSGETIKYFTVKYPNGSTATYGFETNTVGKLIYPLTKIQDINGNLITYTYTEITNTYYLSEIAYGGMSTTSPHAKVKFTYQARTDSDKHFVDGLEIKQSQRLKDITTYFNDQLLLTYSFTYEQKTVSLLKKIDCMSNSKYLNPLIFYYGENNQVTDFQFYTSSFDTYYTGKLVLSRGKFDPDNSNDDGLISHLQLNNYGEIAVVKNWLGVVIGYEYGSQYHPNQDLFIYTDLASGYSVPSRLKAEKGFMELLALDVDGDGVDEIVKLNTECITPSIEKITYKVYKTGSYLGSNTVEQKYSFSTEGGGVVNWSGAYSVPRRIQLVGNFFGNGKQTILHLTYTKNIKGDYNRSFINVVDFDNKKKSAPHEQECFDFNLEDRVYAVDHDGDGKTDICHISSDGLRIYSFGNTGKLALVFYDKTITNSSLNNKELLIGDINGDGKTDYLLSPKKNDITKIISYRDCMSCDGCLNIGHCYRPQEIVSTEFNATSLTWNLWLSTGTALNKATVNIDRNNDYSKFLLQDMNSDGKSDLVISQSGTLKVYLASNGSLKTSAEPKSIAVANNNDAYIIPGSVSRNSRSSQLLSIYGSKLTPLTFTQNDTKQQLLTGVINSTGVISKHNFGDIREQYSGVYSRGTKAVYPYMNLGGNMNVLAGTTIYLNNTAIASNSISYTKGVIHLQGRGFTGFEQIKTYDNIRDTEITQEFDPINFGVPKSTETSTTLVTNTYNVSISANKTAKLTLASSVEKDKLKETFITKRYGFDTYGNKLSESITGSTGEEYNISSTYKNVDNATTYLIGLPLEEKISNYRNGSAPMYSSTYITYNIKNLPETKKHYNSYSTSSLVSEELYTYYANGNLDEVKSKTYASPEWLTHKYVYDTFDRLTRKTDPLGLYIDYVYNLKSDLSSTKNYKGHETKYEYDNWRRKTKTTHPDGVLESSVLSWATSPTGAVILSTNSLSGKPTVQVYLDALGREIRKGEQRFDGKYLYVDNVFDSKGRPDKTSLPFKGANPTQWNKYSYDVYDRPSIISYASGKKDTFDYVKNSVTETKDNVSTTKTYDASAILLSVADPAGIITYNYRADGQLSSIVAPGNIKTSFTYDTYGRQTAISDPSAGSKTFSYDPAGNLNQETEANGKITKLVYDKYNRAISREVVGEFTTTFTYNTDGLLTGETSTNGTSKSFTYDNLLRVITEKETVVDGKWMQKAYTYQSGNISLRTYTSNSATTGIGSESYIYKNGHLADIKFGMAGKDSIKVWQLTQETDMGLAAQAVTGIFTRTYSYDAFGLPTARTVKNGSVTIQNLGYSFNAQTGNLQSRKDNTRNIQENFGYDELNRLISFGGSTISYDIKGNLTNHSSIGQFDYSKEKPYAIEYVTPYGTSIPLRNQDIIYNGLMRVSTISENQQVATFSYNSNGDRVKMHLKKNNADELIRHYIAGQYEVDAGVAGAKERLYLGGDAYSAAAVLVREGTGAWNVYYLARDYQGSITHIVDASGNVKQELSYDPWGRLRNPLNQLAYATGSEPALFLGRGYTGHEHLTSFGLINMNARLYDPVLGRFLSPDPYVQAPEMSQNFNRYSYALNNPLKYNDESGKFIHIIIGAVVGGVFNWASNGFQFNKYGLASFTVGAVIGAGSALLGGAVAGFTQALGILPGAAVGAVSGAAMGGLGSFTLNGMNNMLKSESFGKNGGKSLASGAIFGAIGGAIGGGMKGYKNAQSKGANKWTGNKSIGTKVYASDIKKGILPQADQSKGCYAVADEYASSGRDNITRADFETQASNLNDNKGIVPDAADPIQVYETLTRKRAMQVQSWNAVGNGLKSGSMEVMGVVSNAGTNHAVNVVGYTVETKLRIFGGGVKEILKSVTFWDPLVGTTTTGHSNFLKVGYFQY